eukprot:jgi/Tetstr1/462875/TSEL_007824.t1
MGWSKTFQSLGINVVEMTGDSTPETSDICQGADIMCTTAEKLVSATIPNAVDIAKWLHVPPTGLKIYGNEMRPVQLETHVKAYHRPRTDFLLEQRLSENGIEWLQHTFMYIRARKAPQLYGVQSRPAAIRPHVQMFDRTLQEKYILKNTDKLITHGLAHSPDSNYSTLSPTPLGKLMSSHCVRLTEHGFGTLQSLDAAEPRTIERAAQKPYPFGSQLISEVRQKMPPKVDLKISAEKLPRGAVRCSLALTRACEGSTDGVPRSTGTRAHLFAGTPHDDQLYLFDKVELESFQSPLVLSFVVESSTDHITNSKMSQLPLTTSRKLVAYIMIDDLVKLLGFGRVQLLSRALMPSGKLHLPLAAQLLALRKMLPQDAMPRDQSQSLAQPSMQRADSR